MNKYSIDDFYPEGVVVDAGLFPQHPVPLGILDASKFIVCCDGAADRFIASGRIPSRIVGDCDSLSPGILRQYASIVRRFPDQDTNDQTKAVRYLASKGVRRIAILGATGLREDHTLGNISLLKEYMLHGIQARIYTDFGVFLPVGGDGEFFVPAGTQVSIFNFGATGMRSEGLRWPLRDFSNWWEGTLNETTGSSFSIRANGDYIIFINYPASGRQCDAGVAL